MKVKAYAIIDLCKIKIGDKLIIEEGDPEFGVCEYLVEVTSVSSRYFDVKQLAGNKNHHRLDFMSRLIEFEYRKSDGYPRGSGTSQYTRLYYPSVQAIVDENANDYIEYEFFE